MTIFDELRAAYRASQDTYRNYAGDCLRVAHQLADEFRAYIGAPETYTDPDDETRRPYVRLLAFQLQDDTPVAVQPQSQADILARDPDGFWRFALSLTLERDPDSFPKQSIAFFLRLKVRGAEWHVQLLDHEFLDHRFEPPGDAEKRDLFGHMVDMVTRVLEAKPWEGIEKLPIGFELERPKPPTGDDPDALLEAP